MDFIAKIVGNYTTVSSYENGIFIPDPFVIGVSNETKLQNLTVHAKFIQNKCTTCGEYYNLKLQIIESRPTFESVDRSLPTLVVWHGWASPRGSFDFHVTEGLGHLMAPHYFKKESSRVYFYMLEAGATFKAFETRRYYNTDLWPPYGNCGNAGVIGYQESDSSTILWVNGPIHCLYPHRDVEVKETTHKKCIDKWIFLDKIGCTKVYYLEEDGERSIKYDNTIIQVGELFTYHRPEIEEHKETIQRVLGKVGLTLLDKCDWIAEDACDNNCSLCIHENSWKIVPV